MIEELKESIQEEGLASITPQGSNAMAVSYTHLTLPTIYSV